MSHFTVIYPALLSLVLALAGPARSAPVKCDNHNEGNVQVQEAVVRIKSKPRIELTRQLRLDGTSHDQQLVATLSQGAKTITQVTIAIASADASVTVTRTFGFGFKGLHEIVITRTGGTSVVTADGHPVSIAALQANPPSLVFEDGTAAPVLKVKPNVRRVLQKSKKLAGKANCQSGASIQPALRDECDRCWTKCFVIGDACFAAETISCALSAGISCGAEAVLSFFDDSINCSGQLRGCTDLCNSVGHECCRFSCGGTCCGVDASADNELCVGAKADFAGQCCTRGHDCGPKCCGPTFPTFNGPGVQTECADPTIGLCCIAGQKCGNDCCQLGTVCKNPAKKLCCSAGSDPCGSFCCPPGQRCVVPSDEDFELVVCQACPLDKTGPVCGSTCCGPNEVCDFKNECCNSNQLCGDECCDAEHCLNGTVCCKNGTACGSQCCDGIGQTCCNGACCSGQCVAGVCCPENRSCGPTCCAPGNYCANSQTGLCAQCPSGQEPCAGSENGGPTCCPSSIQCCVNECCPTGMECCEGPFDTAPTCHTTCVR